MKASFLDGLTRGVGLLIPGLVIAVSLWYRQQHLSAAQNFAVVGIMVLLVFCVVGYSVFHRLLWHRFGRATLFCFVTWVAIVMLGRIYDFFFYISPDDLRTLYTGSALLFTVNLTFFVWLRPWAVQIVKFIYGGEVVPPPEQAPLFNKSGENE